MSRQEEERVGHVIAGKWRVDALLGSGSMAAVYAATHRNGARAALKILHPNLCADRSVCERFLGEGYLTNAVKHSGIVRVLDDGVTDDGCVFLVMDLLDGMTLEALRQERGGQIDYIEALDIADKLMDVLETVHAGGIIHRDLKPQNVFVCRDGTVKLLDFGVARVLDQGAQSKLSMFGLILGTPSFMSPEQALGARDKVDHRTDIWSLAATLFTALTGQTVHLGPNAQARLLAAAKQNARSIALVKQDLPPAIAAPIDMALRYKKEDRWQSVEAFRRALRAAREELGLGVPDSAPVPAWLNSQEAPTLPKELHGSDRGDQADQGERALAMMVRSNHEQKRTTSATMAGLPPDPAQSSGQSFQSTTVKMRLPMPSVPPEGRPMEGGHAPLGGHRPPMMSSTEGSYPAAYSTLEGVDSRSSGARRSTMAFWLGALAVVALGGFGAFFAVRGANARNAQTTAAPPTGTLAMPMSGSVAVSATLSGAAAPSASIPPSEASAAAHEARPEGKPDGGTRPSAGGAPQGPARTTRAFPPSRDRPEPPPRAPRTPVTSTRPEDQVIPPDPFGTPD